MTKWLDDLQNAALTLDVIQWQLQGIAGDIYRMFGESPNYDSLDNCINELAATRMLVREGTSKAVDEFVRNAEQASANMLIAALAGWELLPEEENDE